MWLLGVHLPITIKQVRVYYGSGTVSEQPADAAGAEQTLHVRSPDCIAGLLREMTSWGWPPS